MIKPLNTIQLSSAKQRTGLQSIGDLLPRLIRQYEMQAELTRKQESRQQETADSMERQPVAAFENAAFDTCEAVAATQVTFNWYE